MEVFPTQNVLDLTTHVQHIHRLSDLVTDKKASSIRPERLPDILGL